MTETANPSNSIHHAFAELLLGGILLFVRYTTPLDHSNGFRPSLSWMVLAVPELRPLASYLSNGAQTWNARLHRDATELAEYYRAAGVDLVAFCACVDCIRHLGTGQHRLDIRTHRLFCLRGIGETILKLVCLLFRLILDTPLMPTCRGLIYIYTMFSQPTLVSRIY